MDNISVQQMTLLVVVVMLAISLITALISLWLETDRTRQWYGDWFQGVSTEMIGAVVTTIFFTFIVGAVQDQQAEVELKTQLITQLSSVINAEAVRASEELARRGWVKDGSLREVDLSFADLSGALLFVADLEGATMFSTTLIRADLTQANLSNANLQAVDMERAALEQASFAGSNLETANFKQANLRFAVFAGANLLNANFEQADLTGARFDTSTTLPDGSLWTPQTDIARFSDPAHPNFWRPQSESGVLPWWAEPDS